MFKKNITVPNFDGVMTSRDYYFNLTKPEILKIEMTESWVSPDGTVINKLSDRLKNLSERGGKGEDVVEFMEKLIEWSYGVRSEDGNEFYKDVEELRKFKASMAYAELLSEFYSDENAVPNFINAVFPKDYGTPAPSDQPDPTYRPQSPAQRAESQALPAQPQQPTIPLVSEQQQHQPLDPNTNPYPQNPHQPYQGA